MPLKDLEAALNIARENNARGGMPKMHIKKPKMGKIQNATHTTTRIDDIRTSTKISRYPRYCRDADAVHRDQCAPLWMSTRHG